MDITLDEIYALSDYSAAWVDEGKVYVGTESCTPTQLITALILGRCGSYANYGAAYGCASLAAEALGWAKASEDADAMPEDIDSLDLNLLCFNERFVSERDAQAASATARRFARDYLEAHTQDELLEPIGLSAEHGTVSRFNEILSAWYSSQGVKSRLSEIRYRLGGELYDYSAQSRYADCHIPMDWHDWQAYVDQGLVEADFLHADYPLVKRYYESVGYEMAQYCELFGKPEQPLADIWFGTTGNISYAEVARSSIYLVTINSLMHEYLHLLTYNNINLDEWWAIEAIPSYFDVKHNSFGNELMQRLYNDISDFLGEGVDTSVAAAFASLRDGAIDWKRTDATS